MVYIPGYTTQGGLYTTVTHPGIPLREAYIHLSHTRVYHPGRHIHLSPPWYTTRERQRGLSDPFHCWLRQKGLSDTHFTVGFVGERPATRRLPRAALTRFTVGRHRSLSRCAHLSTFSQEERLLPPYHPFHCWARKGGIRVW